jgi:hypothetical protein
MKKIICYKRKEKKKMTLIESVLIIGSVVGGLMTSMCWNIRRSRCERIESPCVSCMRKPMTENELKMDVLNNATMNRTYNSEASTPKMTRSNSEPDYNKAT